MVDLLAVLTVVEMVVNLVGLMVVDSVVLLVDSKDTSSVVEKVVLMDA